MRIIQGIAPNAKTGIERSALITLGASCEEPTAFRKMTCNQRSTSDEVFVNVLAGVLLALEPARHPAAT